MNTPDDIFEYAGRRIDDPQERFRIQVLYGLMPHRPKYATGGVINGGEYVIPNMTRYKHVHCPNCGAPSEPAVCSYCKTPTAMTC